jgi:hypothetical protein
MPPTIAKANTLAHIDFFIQSFIVPWLAFP